MRMQAPDDSGCLQTKQMVACHTTCVCCSVLVLLFLTQASMDLVAGWVSTPSSLFQGDGAPLATLHAFCSAGVCVIIVSVVVKYEEMMAVYHLVQAPFVAAAAYTSQHLGLRYSKVPTPDE